MDSTAAGSVWGGLALLSIVLGGGATLALWAHRRRLAGPSAFPWSACLGSVAFVGLLGWYPAVLLYLRLRGRVSRAAGDLLPLCKSRALRTACLRACERLGARVAAEMNTRHEAVLMALIVGIPPLLAVAFFAHCAVQACKNCRESRVARADAEDGGGAVHLEGRADAATVLLALKVVPEEEAGDAQGEECSICLDDLWEQTAVAVRCGHRFHRACLYRWLHGAPQPSCPLCKASIWGEAKEERLPS